MTKENFYKRPNVDNIIEILFKLAVLNPVTDSSFECKMNKRIEEIKLIHKNRDGVYISLPRK